MFGGRGSGVDIEFQHSIVRANLVEAVNPAEQGAHSMPRSPGSM